jgi:CubicO group peptidase (beta-lactamase class C family)
LHLNPVLADDGTNPLAEFVEHGMDLWHVPGMAVAVVSSSEVEFSRGFGATTIDGGTPVDEHTLFANASTTKAMVAMGLLMLVDEGRLTLDDPIVRYLPELRFKDPLLTAEVSVRDLLTHRTGLPSTDIWSFMQHMPLEEQIRRLAFVAPTAPLRTRHIYQNTMYELIGVLIEQLSGQRWDRFLTERLWLPLGMTGTVGARGQIADGVAYVLPHEYRGGRVAVTDWDLPADMADAAGSAWTSIHDMSLWAQFLLRGGITVEGKRLVSEAGFAEMFKPQSLIDRDDFYPTAQLTQPNWTSYGLGWFQQDYQGRQIDFHTGSLAGLIAIIGLDRANDRAVIVLGNRDHAEMRHAVLWEVMDNSPAAARTDWNQDVFDLYNNQAGNRDAQWEETLESRLKKTRPSLPVTAYAGRYTNPALGSVTIEYSGRDLQLRTAAVGMPMSHWHLDTFLVEYESWELREFAEFRIGPDGRIKSFLLFDQEFQPAGEN